MSNQANECACAICPGFECTCGCQPAAAQAAAACQCGEACCGESCNCTGCQGVNAARRGDATQAGERAVSGCSSAPWE